MNKTKITKLAHLYIKNIEKNGIPITSAYVFGSQINPETLRTDSDIDICIVSPVFGHDRIRERVLLMRLREGISDRIEPHPLSDDELNSSINPFAQEIKTTGIKVQ